MLQSANHIYPLPKSNDWASWNWMCTTLIGKGSQPNSLKKRYIEYHRMYKLIRNEIRNNALVCYVIDSLFTSLQFSYSSSTAAFTHNTYVCGCVLTFCFSCLLGLLAVINVSCVPFTGLKFTISIWADLGNFDCNSSVHLGVFLCMSTLAFSSADR